MPPVLALVAGAAVAEIVGGGILGAVLGGAVTIGIASAVSNPTPAPTPAPAPIAPPPPPPPPVPVPTTTVTPPARMVRQPITSHRIVYGEVAPAGRWSTPTCAPPRARTSWISSIWWFSSGTIGNQRERPSRYQRLGRRLAPFSFAGRVARSLHGKARISAISHMLPAVPCNTGATRKWDGEHDAYRKSAQECSGRDARCIHFVIKLPCPACRTHLDLAMDVLPCCVPRRHFGASDWLWEFLRPGSWWVTAYHGRFFVATVGFISEKGGVGKTTACYHVAVALRRYHKKSVLVIDADYQRGGITGRFFPDLIEGFRTGTLPGETLFNKYQQL